MRAFLAVALLSLALVAAAHAQVWIMSPSGGGGVSPALTPPPAGCISPTAPDGAVDLSQCSNAFYAAVIF